MNTRILSVFNLLKRVGFAILFLGASFVSHLIAAPLTVNAPSNTYFIANEGQWEGDFSFKCEVGSAVYYVTPKGLTVDFRQFKRYPKPRDPGNSLDMMDRHEDRDSVTVRGHVVQIHYSGTNRSLTSTGEGKLAHYSNYFLGRDSTKWRSHVGHYQNIIVSEVWPGIDVEYRADQLGVETIYHVKPGADPGQIQMEYLGLDVPLRVDAQGNLVLTTSLCDMKEQAPYAYQMDGRVQSRVGSAYRIIDGNRVAFEFEGFCASKDLVIDPLLYGTYLGGGASDDCFAVSPDPNGGVYVVGYTYAMSGFPTTLGAYEETGQYFGIRGFVSHFGADGEFIASTLLGETQTEENPNTDGYLVDVAYDSLRGSVWLCGNGTTDWPVTPDALDTVGDPLRDAIILRLSSDLTSLEFCSYLGGEARDVASAIKVDFAGLVYLTGSTSSDDFPLTPDAIFNVRQSRDCFVCVFDPAANSVVFSTYIGGSLIDWEPVSLQIASNGSIWITDRTESPDIPITANAHQQTLADTSLQLGDVMVCGIDLDLPPTICYCSYVGGGGYDFPFSLEIGDSVLFVSGVTNSTDFPVSSGAFDTSGPAQLAPDYNDGFVASLNWLTDEYHGTYIGGGGADRVMKNEFRLSPETVTLLGRTTSVDFPITGDAFQIFNAGDLDGFVIKLNRDLSRLMYGTYVGGSAEDQFNAAWRDGTESMWIVGNTLSIDFPTTPNAIQPGDNALTSGFVAHFAIDTTEDTTSATHNNLVPNDFTLTVFPNPFNPTTTLSFSMPTTSDVQLIVHGITGREVLRENLGRLAPGLHGVQIDGSGWASGIYFVTLNTLHVRQVKKLLLIR